MRHEDTFRTREAERLRLRFGGVFEHARGDKHRRNAARLEIGDVVHTARRTRPSIGQGFDDDLTALGDLTAQIRRRRLGEGRLPKPFNLQAALAQ